MNEMTYMNPQLANERINERVQAAERARLVHPRRPRHQARHALAASLHKVAERLDN